MKLDKSKKVVEELLSIAGVKINGKNPWDIQVHNDKFYSRVLAGGSLALGESYMDKWWDCEKLDEFFFRVLDAELDEKVRPNALMLLEYSKAKIFNKQSKSKAFEIGKKHYDAGNDLYKIMLDKRMVYTCAYWRNSKNLDSAQEAKLDLVCKKIGLKKGQKILDIGCGWGSFAKFAAEKYKVKVVGITVSNEQVKLGRELCRGLPVEIRLQDYRDVNEKFDHIISLGMFEHVGYKNYRVYMEVVSRCLKDNGLFLLHTIGRNESTNTFDPWLEKYIFPNTMVPSVKQIADSSEGLFIIEDFHNLNVDYYKTAKAWHKNFTRKWLKIKSNYNERFRRMWNYYLLVVAGSFKARKNQLWQIVFSKKGVLGGYESVR